MTEIASPKSKLALVVISLATVVAVYFGWRLFWFLTDDAFIAFRYISNSHLGYGYVWNAPPFRPVEGYTSFLWVVLLDVVWRVSGVEPPAAANYVSLLFTYLTLLVGGLMVLKLKLAEEPWEASLAVSVSGVCGSDHEPHVFGLEQFGAGDGDVQFLSHAMDLLLFVCEERRPALDVLVDVDDGAALSDAARRSVVCGGNGCVGGQSAMGREESHFVAMGCLQVGALGHAVADHSGAYFVAARGVRSVAAEYLLCEDYRGPHLAAEWSQILFCHSCSSTRSGFGCCFCWS